MTTYTLHVRFKDGTGHTYKNLSRTRVAELTAKQFSSQFDRPEELHVTTERKQVFPAHHPHMQPVN